MANEAADRAAETGALPRDRGDRGRTPAQLYAYIFGATLVLVGLLGFIADSAFDTGMTRLDGDKLLAFEVNGWHNLVHLLSGALLLAAAPKRSSAKLITLGFGLTYGIVTVIGLIDGQDVLGLFPVNPADNVLHILLTVAAIGASLVSRADDRELYEGGGASPPARAAA